MTVANGILYASSMAKEPNQNQMFALDAATGAILWQFGAGSSVNAGPAVVRWHGLLGIGILEIRRGRQRQQPAVRVQHRRQVVSAEAEPSFRVRSENTLARVTAR